MTRTEHDELDTKIVRSSAWALLGFGGLNLLSLATTIVLARLLVPDDFGVVALTLAVLAVASIAQESGLGAALIVHRGDLRRAAATVSVFSPFVSLVLYATVFALAPLFAELLDEPRLVDVLRVTALTLVARGLAIMPIALLQREMRFRSITAIELAAGVAQSSTAIASAALGAGVWSLVAGQLALSGAQLVLAWWLVPFRASPLESSWRALRELGGFGRHVAFANLLNYGNASAEDLVVGRTLGVSPLGLFTVAKRLAAMPVHIVGNILGRGVYAALAQLQDDRDGMRRVWLENVQRVALFSIPATIGVIVVADPLVRTLLGEQWVPAVLTLQILALNGAVRTFSTTTGEVFQALRRPQLRVAAEVVHLVLLLPALVLGARWQGIEGAAAAIVLVNAATGLPFLYVAMRQLRVAVRELAATLTRPAVGWVVMAIALLALRPIATEAPPAAELIALAAAGAAAYAVAVALVAREPVVTMWRSLRGVRVSGRPGERPR
jgi:O-antigen/teichoic acid export membrane protein